MCYRTVDARVQLEETLHPESHAHLRGNNRYLREIEEGADFTKAVFGMIRKIDESLLSQASKGSRVNTQLARFETARGRAARELWLIAGVMLLLMLLSAGSVVAQGLDEEEGVNVVVNAQDRVPIAVSDAVGKGSVDAQIGKDIAVILRRDFEISGVFDVIDPTAVLPGLDGETLVSTDYAKWFSSGAEALVKAEYSLNGSSLEIDFRLYDTTKAKEISITYEKPAATADKFRMATHAFANAVVQYYTGQEGIFGQTLLVVRKGKGSSHVYQIGTDGAGLTKVSSGSGINLLPAWGPGGGVLFTSYDSGNPDLVLSSGSSTSSLSGHSGLNSGADYCAKSGRIALTLTKDENPEIYTIGSDGSGLQRLTDNAYIDTSPSWSGDCSKLAFVSNRGGSAQIYVMNADGSGATLVTNVGTYNTSPSWGKGGKIAFTARDEYNVFDIFVVDPNSGYMERLTQDQGNNEEPTWSPGGGYLAFTSTRDGGSKLFIMTSDGRFQTAVTDGGGFETPAWSH
ncbi:MAG: hypothetical protein CO108_18130 [Deltaproteobacteria bacterium CG_4_9_14_3_um_filter_63_12]|nr:MAG: hypothetical protein CO108_18130 [Deltaproteobacteria bacterium CG_4_9_14_3_um_filter_63_12]